MALANYNLEITDSLNSVINKLKINATYPQLLFEPSAKNKKTAYIKTENERDVLYINFRSAEATSYNISLKCYIIDYPKLIVMKWGDLTFGKQFLITNVTRSYQLDVTDLEYESYENLLVFVIGSFSKDPLGKYVVPFNGAFNFNFKDNQSLSGIQTDFMALKRLLKIE